MFCFDLCRVLLFAQIDESGKILKLEKYCPWKEHLFQLEEENDLGDDIKYVLYQDTSSNWRIQCVPAGRDTFANRLVCLIKFN